MKTTIHTLGDTGLAAVDILIPGKQFDLRKWAVVACDQYTSEPEYWEEAAAEVGSDPSTLNLIFPEVYLGNNDADRIQRINAAMNTYISEDIFTTYEQSLILVHRTTPAAPQGRWGLVAALDLEKYDYSKDSDSPVRATEGTILERIPPRKAIRRDAPLELPHILVLIDDEMKTVIEPLAAVRDSLEKIYDFDLMKNGGHVRAYRIASQELFTQVTKALYSLSSEDRIRNRYGKADRLLFAMGDGNHSLATAKSCWEDIKKELPAGRQAQHPARFALVEIENIFDPGITFEAIHRVLFNAVPEDFFGFLLRHCSSYREIPVEDVARMNGLLADDSRQLFGLKTTDGFSVIEIINPEAQITAGTLQLTIDEYLQSAEGVEIDYTHGDETTFSLGCRPGNMALFLPAISKSLFFQAIISDGALPRKTFSMGEANEKRYYIEARRIR